MSAAYPEAEMVTAEMEYSAKKSTTSVSAADESIVTPIAVATSPEQTMLNSTTATRHQSVQVLGERQGSTCCGCCCDYRRAVIIVNIVIGILEAILLILALVAVGNTNMSVAGDGPEMASQYQKIEMIFSGISILLSTLAIAGAYTYNIILVSLHALWLVTAFVLGIFFSLEYCNDYCDTYNDDFYACTCGVNIPTLLASGVVMCLFVYPHVGFIIQVRKGIIPEKPIPAKNFLAAVPETPEKPIPVKSFL
eukprot:CAMPEP_0202481890 /NCGR_PEP_ID=MMETSP1361-20130828/1356_1 /ASSEMBLY_ACC=CAM_ASM_000849 /TAXON_ID=210615 /ORGANISM="Staurosira complex sp., Strain CCMP2646" /LENGTH=250 /DNA_ID=CAMNT_0049109531 /DNA_START=13 /DNA_END=763 /DNA_ORIENTATION=-